jgi:hypothetical protein
LRSRDEADPLVLLSKTLASEIKFDRPYLVLSRPWKTGRKAHPLLPAYQTAACSWPVASYRPALHMSGKPLAPEFKIFWRAFRIVVFAAKQDTRLDSYQSTVR